MAHRDLIITSALFAAAFSYAEEYLTEEQAKDVLFPGETFTDADVTLTKDQMKQIAKASDTRVRNEKIRALKTSKGGWLLFDSVVGKHEFIDYVVALHKDGSVKGVEILTYRETYGHQVRDPKWRAQFNEKTVMDPLKLDQDIKNISGATLSSNNITKGVRRILHTWKIAIQPS